MIEKNSGVIIRSAVILMGFNALWLQVFLIRELLVTFSGNELVIGIFLANWLFLTAAGSFISSRIASKVRDVYFAYTILQVAISFFFPIVIYYVRTIKYQMGIVPGEGIALPLLFLVSFMLILPVAFLVGFQFGFACRLIAESGGREDHAVSRAYFFEALGSMTGGLLLGQVFMLKFDSFTGAAILALLNIFQAVLLIYRSDRLKFWRIILILLFTVWTGSIFAGLLGSMNSVSRAKQWQDYNVITAGNSVYGNAILLGFQDELIMVSNGVPVATIPAADLAHTEDLIDLPLFYHSNPESVLMIGGAPGGPLEELVKHPVKHIDYVDIDPLLIELLTRFAPDSSFASFRDPRITFNFTDARYFLKNVEKQYDVILLNLPEPSTLEINRFYTAEFFGLCRSAMAPDGILAFTLPGSISSMGKALCQMNNAIISAVRNYYSEIIVFPDSYNLYICSDDPGIREITPDLVESRRLKRKIGTQLISVPYMRIKSDSLRQAGFTEQTVHCPVSSENRDLKPLAVFFSLLYWNGMYAPALAGFLDWFEEAGTGPVIAVLVLLFIMTFFIFRRSPKRSMVSLLGSISGSGFAGMGITVILVLLFQSTFGYIYSWIGFLLAAFMGGLAAGSWHATVRTAHYSGGTGIFIMLEFLLTGYLIILLILVQFRLNELPPDLIKIIFMSLIVCCGYLVGAEFSVAAGQAQKAGLAAQRTGGLIYAADLLGAWLGGLTITAVFVPAVGIPQTLLLLIVLKLLTSVFYWVVHIPSRA